MQTLQDAEQSAAPDSHAHVLLGELHHRWSNNLSIISSTLNLAHRKRDDREHLGRVILEVARSTQLMAQVSRSLAYPPPSSDFKEFCRTICGAIIEIHGRANVALKVDCDEVGLNARQLQIFAMLMVEFVTNCCKHSYNSGDAGTIHVTVLLDGPDVVMRVSDDGRGAPPTRSPKAPLPRIGEALASLLKAQMTFTAAPQVLVEIRCPNAPTG